MSHFRYLLEWLDAGREEVETGMRISHIGFVVSKHLANAPQPLATNAQARELQSVRRRNNLQTLHRPMDTINKPQDLDPPAA